MDSARTHPWLIPGVRINDPLGADQLPITPWKSLKFHPIGLVHLRRYQGALPHVPNFFKMKQASFEASDLAWFAAGLHKDGNHHRAQDSFHSEYFDLYNTCGADAENRTIRKALLQRLLDLIFDLATLLDRAGGGTTLVLHAKGTTQPGALKRPEYLKADVCFPPEFIARHPSCRPALFKIAQDFIAHIGVPTAEDWNSRVGAYLGWSFSATHSTPPANKVMLDVPPPLPRTNHYVFRGQPASQETLPSDAELDDHGADNDTERLLTSHAYQEHISQLNAELDDLRQDRNELCIQVLMLESMLDIDSGPIFHPATPKTPSRIPVSQHGTSPESSFVTMRSERYRPPPASATSSARNLGATAQSPSRDNGTSGFTSPMSNVISPSRGHFDAASSTAISRTATTSPSSTNTKTASPSVLTRVLKRHGVSPNLEASVSLILQIFSAASDAERLARELKNIGVPEDAISDVRKAFVIDGKQKGE